MYSLSRLFTLLILTGTGTVALSQTGTLEEVIVTATKRAESLQDVPVTVNAISATTLKEAGVVDLGDIAQLVPSLTVSTNLSPFATGIRIRGIGTSQNNVGLEASVAFVVDGVYMGRSGLGMSDLTDIERVEVLQGPQGTLYGKNSNAGVVSVVTKNPNFEEAEGYLEATLGNYGLRQYTATATGPINDTTAYLLAGNWREQDGWLKNNSGPDEMSFEDWNLRGKLQWRPSDALSIMLTASHVDRSDRCCGADALQSDTFLELLAASDFPVPKNDAFNWKNNSNQSNDFDMKSDTAILTVDYDLASAQLTSLSSYNDYDYKTSTDADRSEFDILAIVNDRYKGHALSQEFRLTSDLEGPLQYLAGLYYLRETNKRGNGTPFTFLGQDILTVGTAALGPQLALIAAPGDYIAAKSTWETEASAAFGQTTYSFNEEWLLTIGLRYTSENKSIDGYSIAESTAPAANIPGIPTFVEIIATPGELDEKTGEDGFTWLVNLRYFVNADTMVFASAATGSKSGGFNSSPGEGVSGTFDEETTINYELGIKTQLLDNRLKLNATAFYSEFDDLQFLAQAPQGAGTERERRWLCDGLPDIVDRATEVYLLTDLYITDTQLRLRDARKRDGSVVWPRLARKVDVDASHRLITSIYLSPAELELFKTLPGSTLKKTRYVVDFNGQRMGIDQFSGALQGLVLVEAEFEDDASMAAFNTPDWVSRDVTEDLPFSGGELSSLSADEARSFVSELVYDE